MCDERDNLESVRYWRTPPERVPQRFYVAFCLLMSSVQDFILGQKERASNNLNWSATCSYYSLVHGGRLLCFLALGDYPTSHAKLRHVLSSRPQPRTIPRREQDGYPFDWLRGFATLAGGQPSQVRGNEAGTVGEFRQVIAAYLNHVHVEEVERRLAKVGAMLAAAGPLRNDSNYEALLIAHEYQHVTISEAFDDLSRHMANAAESALPFVIDAFTGFRRHDPDLPQGRDEYESLLHDYVHDRIGGAIRRKLGGSVPMEAKLKDVLSLIDTCSIGARYEHLEAQMSMGVFGGKAHLMREFQGRIENLAKETGA